MLSLGRKAAMGLAAVFAVIAFSAVAPNAVADTVVKYYTVGQFSGGPNITNGTTTPVAAAYAGSSKIDDGVSSLIYDYSGPEALLANAVPSTSDFGTFTMDVPLGSSFDFSPYSFKLSIFQLLPNSNSSFLVGSLTGSVTNVGINTVSLGFSPTNTLFLDPVVYTLPEDFQMLNGGEENPLEGDVSVVPLPAMVNLGGLLFGILGIGYASRKALRRSLPVVPVL